MWNSIKNIFKKKNMNAEIEIIKEQLSKFKKYQWVKSERLGSITEFKDVVFENDNIWVEFVDGSRINYNLLDEYLLKTNFENELLEIDTEPIVQKTNVNSVSVKAAQPSKTVENPIHSLLKRQKPNLVDIEIALQLNVPSSELFNVISESFDNSEEEVVNYIVAGLDIEIIKNSVKEAIKKYYSS